MADKYFPLFINLNDYHILVVGFGKIASRRIKIFSQFTKNITVIAPSKERGTCLTEGINWIQKEIEVSDLEKFCLGSEKKLVLAATNQTKINDQITAWCRKNHVMVNNCSDKNQCDFYFPGIASSEQVIVGITASGSDHALAKEVKNNVQKLLDEMT